MRSFSWKTRSANRSMVIKQLLHGLTHNGEGHARVLMTSILSKKIYIASCSTNTRKFARLGYVCLFFNERPRSLASPLLPVFTLIFAVRPIERFLRRNPARDRMIFIYRSNSFRRWKDSRLLATGEDTFVDVYLLRRRFRAKAAPIIADRGSLRKSSTR